LSSRRHPSACPGQPGLFSFVEPEPQPAVGNTGSRSARTSLRLRPFSSARDAALRAGSLTRAGSPSP
jgi:hypothetical protein